MKLIWRAIQTLCQTIDHANHNTAHEGGWHKADRIFDVLPSILLLQDVQLVSSMFV